MDPLASGASPGQSIGGRGVGGLDEAADPGPATNVERMTMSPMARIRCLIRESRVRRGASFRHPDLLGFELAEPLCRLGC